jgi:hypothetical protein
MTIVYDKSPVAVRAEPLSEVWWQGRQWAVTAYGIERRDGAYVIEARRLAKPEERRDRRPVDPLQALGGFAPSWFTIIAAPSKLGPAI